MSMITRKNFLIGSMSVAAMGARQMFAVPAGSLIGKPRLKFGVVSDTHLDCNTRAWFRSALDWYRTQEIDAFMIAGDMTNYGFYDELLYTTGEWKRAFPNDKGPDGRPVTRLFCYGNHCVWPLAKWHTKKYKTDEELKKGVVVLDPKGAWERAFEEEYKPVYSKTVNGYQFVGTHWCGHDAREAWFNENAKKIDPSQPFFYFQHPHPKDTCYGKWAWGADDGTSTRLLSNIPNAIAFSGHSHFPLTSEETIWQGAFTSIGTGSLNYSGHADYTLSSSNCADAHQGRHGMLVTVCEDHIRIERRDFYTKALSLGDDWIIPIGKGAAKPYEYAKRTTESIAPEFPAGAVAKVALVEKKPDKEGNIKPPTNLMVSYPVAQPQKKWRAFNYEIEAYAGNATEGKPLKTWKQHATDYHLPPSVVVEESKCSIKLKDLPKGAEVRFVVYPVGCFGKRGKAITSTTFTTPA